MLLLSKVKSTLKNIAPPIVYRLTGHLDSYLSGVEGVIHVGANVGQERHRYRRFGLRVLWVEPIPWVFDELVGNISGFKDQVAYQALVTDVDGGTYQLQVANNNGSSSSILELKDHRLIWPDVDYIDSIAVRSATLPSLLESGGYALGDYQALVMDTQGSELLVLRGSAAILDGFSFINTEVADFEAYEGCCQLPELNEFLEDHGFREQQRDLMASRDAVGGYYQILYSRRSS